MRLPGFDYTRPLFYMVTLKRLAGGEAFSAVSPGGELVANEVTRAFRGAFAAFAAKWRCVESLTPYAIMPDHIHFLVKLKKADRQLSLTRLVSILRRDLTRAYWGALERAPAKLQAAAALCPPGAPLCPSGAAPVWPDRAPARSPAAALCPPGAALCPPGVALCPQGAAPVWPDRAPARSPAPAPLPPVFERDWHDWIVMRKGQLAAFNRYIVENPSRAALRRANARYFRRVGKVSFLGREWFAYGNPALLDLPALIPLKGHRATRPDTPEWNALLATASRIGPGGAGVSTFMSPLEKACGNAIARAGGAWVVLSPEGFSPRWHPPRQKEPFCARGRMLYLSLYEATTREPTNAELYARCHEMVDLALNLPTLPISMKKSKSRVEVEQWKDETFHSSTSTPTSTLPSLPILPISMKKSKSRVEVEQWKDETFHSSTSTPTSTLPSLPILPISTAK